MSDHARKLLAEWFGTGILVFFAVGVATLSFGFNLTGASYSAGVVATALAFGLVMFAMVHGIGSISGAHINPAVTLGMLVSKRMTLSEAIGYWIAQFLGAIVGAGLLFAVVNGSPIYSRSKVGLGADGFGSASQIGLNAVGAFLAEVILTALFVYVVITATRKAANPHVAAGAIGLTLTVVHLVGIPLTGTSVNPARSLGPALFAGGLALSQLWLFILAPLVGGVIAAGIYALLHGPEEAAVDTAA